MDLEAERDAWRPASAVILAVGWGANQFAPLLLVYREQEGFGRALVDALFGGYALGLVPGLLLGGPASDRWGRRALVLPAAGVSLLATLVLMASGGSVAGLMVGRLLAGIASGVAFAAGSAWIQELSERGGAAEGAGARRAAVALSLGFGGGPLVAALLAEWAPDPTVVPYTAHLAAILAATAWALRVPETVAAGTASALDLRRRLTIPRPARPRVFGVVLPIAPWVFACATVSVAVLPGIVSDDVGRPVLFSGLITALTLGTGVLIQPVTRRVSERGRIDIATAGMWLAIAGLALAALAAELEEPAVVALAALPLGAAYGVILVSGLREIESAADPSDRGGLIAIFYAFTYIGFAVPVAAALIAEEIGNVATLLGLLALATATLARVALAHRRTQGRPPTMRRLRP